MRRSLLALAFALIAGPALAADCYPNAAGTQANCGAVTMYNNASGQSVPVTAAVPLPTVQTGALPAGTALLGKVGIDQTTPGTTNAVQLTAPSANTYIGNVSTQSTKTTYRAVALLPTIDAAGVLFQLQGSSTKTVRVTKVVLGGSLTTTANGVASIERNSTAAAGGTSTGVTPVALDSANAAGTAVATRWTAVSTGGTTVGVVAGQRTTWTADTLANSAQAVFTFGDDNGQALALRGTAEFMSVKTAGFASYTGAAYTISVEWTEE